MNKLGGRAVRARMFQAEEIPCCSPRKVDRTALVFLGSYEDFEKSKNPHTW